MTFNNDFDVKKFYIGKKENINSVSNELVDDFLLQKSNGNLNIAKQLGAKLGENILLTSKNICIRIRPKQSQNFIANIRILLWVATIFALESTIKNEYILSVAKTSVNNYLQTNHNNFFGNINGSLALSLYTLCKRSTNKKHYGKCFAYLCGKSNNLKFIKLGDKIYKNFFISTLQEIKKYNLKI